jgi:hypothetical protein
MVCLKLFESFECELHTMVHLIAKWSAITRAVKVEVDACIFSVDRFECRWANINIQKYGRG